MRLIVLTRIHFALNPECWRLQIKHLYSSYSACQVRGGSTHDTCDAQVAYVRLCRLAVSPTPALAAAKSKQTKPRGAHGWSKVELIH
jgi:hypothetical protein